MFEFALRHSKTIGRSTASAALETSDVVANTIFGKDKRRVEFFYQFECIDTVDSQVIVTHFQVTRYGPCGT